MSATLLAEFTVNLDVLAEIAIERAHQIYKWGEQNLPDGTLASLKRGADAARKIADTAAAKGELTWRQVLTEEFYEALAETDPVKLRAELVQVAAVAIAWIEAIDWRRA